MMKISAEIEMTDYAAMLVSLWSLFLIMCVIYSVLTPEIFGFAQICLTLVCNGLVMIPSLLVNER